MKKFIIAALAAVVFTASAFAAGNEKAMNKAAAHLEANYASAKDVTWSYGPDFQKASITLGNEKVDVFYDGYGALIGSTKTQAFDKLPKSALEAITTDYAFPDYQLTDCISFTDADNVTTYYVSFDSTDGKTILSISANGKVAVME